MISNIETIVNGVKSQIYEEIGILSSKWKGKTASAFFNSINDNQKTFNKISEQLSSFSQAVKEMENLEKLAQELKTLMIKKDAAKDEEKERYQKRIDSKNSEIKECVKRILTYLSEVLSKSPSNDNMVSDGKLTPETSRLSINKNNYCLDEHGIIIKNDGVPRNGTRKEKLDYLFPNGLPMSPSEASKYMVSTTVEYIDSKGNRKNANIKVHKKLESDVKEIFSKIADTGFQLNPSNYGSGAYIESYFFRKVRGGSNLSEHSFGSAVDLNVPDNPLIGYSRENTKYDPDNNKYAITDDVANIFRMYGWSWGGADWNCNKKGTRYDYMHFDFTTTGPQQQK